MRACCSPAQPPRAEEKNLSRRTSPAGEASQFIEGPVNRGTFYYTQQPSTSFAEGIFNLKEGVNTMANITRWDPFGEFSSLQDRFNQLLGQPREFFHNLAPSMDQPLALAKFAPPVDIYEDDHNVTIQAELPGINEKDLNITLENNVLTISGERKLENEENKDNFHRIERSYGRFTRSFTLPSTLDTENVNAEFNNGVLKIVLNKVEAAKPKQIKVGVNKPAPAKAGKAA
jgi:HSP20 family protein